VTYGGVDLGRVPLDEVRRAILVSETNSQLFAGTLQDAVDPHGVLTREEAEEALRTAAAEDVYDALPGGWQGLLDERGRGLSGGQRQRVVLARALAVDAPILVLVEPTSAVDAHTEARIAERVAEVRRGRTTVVSTVSPLWLHHADRVVLFEHGTATVEGQHEDLLRDSPAYRRVVARAMDAPVEEVSGHEHTRV
jgi:ABC-type multidrug transport system fused ATPase/permease subunit